MGSCRDGAGYVVQAGTTGKRSVSRERLEGAISVRNGKCKPVVTANGTSFGVSEVAQYLVHENENVARLLKSTVDVGPFAFLSPNDAPQIRDNVTVSPDTIVVDEHREIMRH